MNEVTVVGDLTWHYGTHSPAGINDQACGVCGKFIPANRPRKYAYVQRVRGGRNFSTLIHPSHGLTQRLAFRNDGRPRGLADGLRPAPRD